MHLTTKQNQQAETYLGQSQVKLAEVIDEVGVLIVVGVEVEVGVQLLFWVVSGWCMDGWIKRNQC